MATTPTTIQHTTSVPIPEHLAPLVKAACRERPDQAGRILRAVGIVLTGRIEEAARTRDLWYVASAEGQRVYAVAVEWQGATRQWRCTCPDWQHRQARRDGACKHILAVRLWRREQARAAQAAEQPPTPAPTPEATARLGDMIAHALSEHRAYCRRCRAGRYCPDATRWEGQLAGLSAEPR